MDHPRSQADAAEFCETLLRHFAASLSPWEDGFVRSVQAQIGQGAILTQKQLLRLDDIMERCAMSYDGSDEKGGW